MKHFFIITNSYKDKNLRLTRSMKDYIETKGGFCGFYVSRGEENDSDCIRPEVLPDGLDLIFVIGGRHADPCSAGYSAKKRTADRGEPRDAGLSVRAGRDDGF